MPPGLSLPGEILQKHLQQELKRLSVVAGIADYIRIHAEHDGNLCIFLWTALDAFFFSCWEFTRAYVLFWLNLISESIYSTRNRIFIIQLSLL